MIDGVTGTFFMEQTVDALLEAVDRCTGFFLTRDRRFACATIRD